MAKKQSIRRIKIKKILADEGLHAYQWSNRPGDVYGAHTHSYHKVIYVLQGSITFGLPDKGDKVTLNAGDRLELAINKIDNLNRSWYCNTK